MLNITFNFIMAHFTIMSSVVIFLSLGSLREWMRIQMPAKSFLSLLLRAGDVHLGGHVTTYYVDVDHPK